MSGEDLEPESESSHSVDDLAEVCLVKAYGYMHRTTLCPVYTPSHSSGGILGDLTMITSIAPGLEQHFQSNFPFSTYYIVGEHRRFDCIHATSVVT